MQHLSAELLAIVLSRLDEPSDFVRSSAVCKQWATGVSQLRPKALNLWHWRNPEQEGDTSWLQAWQLQGRLQNLQDVSWVEDSPDLHYNSIFSYALLSYAALWNLHTCRLDGGFCFKAALCLLPTSLKHLALHPNVAQKALRLSKFERFTDLEHLTVGPHWAPRDEMSFSVNNCLMTNLKCLDLAPGAAIAYTLDADSDIAGCLPNLVKLRVRTPQNSFELACRIIALPHLQMLYLLMSESSDEKNKFVVRGKAQLVIATQWNDVQLFLQFFVHEFQAAGMDCALDPLAQR